MNTQYNDIQLKQALAKMLPEVISWHDEGFDELGNPELYWLLNDPIQPDTIYLRNVLDTELLHLCWLVEETLGKEDMLMFCIEMDMAMDLKAIHATWQERVIALAKVKGIEII